MKPVRKRRGVVLLITLSVIASMLALVGVMFAYIETARKEAGERAALLQADLVRADLQEILTAALRDRADPAGLYGMAFSVRERDGDFRLSVACAPLLDRLRLSWLGWEDNASGERYHNVAKDLFDGLCDQAGIREPNRLYRMIVDTLEGKRERYGIRMGLQGKKGIISPNGWKEILDEYRYQADDPAVYGIEWERYFTLVDPPGSPPGVDGNYIRPELLARLYGREETTVRQAYRFGDLNRTLTELGEERVRYDWLFLSSPPVAAECRVDMTFMGKTRKVRLTYFAKRIEDFQLEK